VARDLNLLSGLRALGSNATFWLAVVCMSVPLGVYAPSYAFVSRGCAGT
jgi:hypothetical protein